MLKSDITFQEDCFLTMFKVDKDSIIDPLFEILSKAITQYNIKSLKSVIIKDIALFEKDLGKVEFDDWTGTLNSTLTLGYITAINLRKDSLFYSESKYLNALATVWHELFHIYDRESAIQPLLDSVNNPPQSFYSGIKFWTEFYAVYSTFSIYEQPHIMQDFQTAFSTNPLNEDRIKYNISRLLGYWLHKGHCQECNHLIHEHIKAQTVLAQIDNHLLDMMERHPLLTTNDFTTLDALASGLLPCII